jgi:DNA mismatch endonuclease (patch repair protein)
MAPASTLYRNQLEKIDPANMPKNRRVDNAPSKRRLADAARRGYAPPSTARSQNMAAVRRSNTTPELILRKALHAAGYRFRKDYPIRAGGRLIRPDVAFTRRRVAVFVDGCFWHGCPTHGQVPATNVAFWTAKLDANIKRDRLQDRLLKAEGWSIVRIWEHEPIEGALAEVIRAVG